MDQSVRQTEKFDVTVIGGGPSGLSAGHEVATGGVSVVVLEKAAVVGGIARTESHRGFHFDMGGHRFFSKSEAVNEFWNHVLAERFRQRSRLSRIYYRKRFFAYPLKGWDTVAKLGIVESGLIFLSYLRWKAFPHREEKTFKQWVTNRFGRRLFQTFFESYTEKVWGISCSELSAEWAAQRIRGLSLKTAVLNMLRPPGQTIKTLIESFQYPDQGPGMMWREVASRIDRLDGSVMMNSGVARLERSGSRIERVIVNAENGEEAFESQHFISSMPLTELVRFMDPPPPPEILDAANKLKYRDFLTVCLIVDGTRLFDDNWIYIHDPDVKVGRIQNYKNWSPQMVPDPNKTSLGLEYFCNEGDELWNMPDDELVELGRRELQQLGLINADAVEDGCVFRVEKSYPVYDSTYREQLDVLRAYIRQFENLQTIGRNGLHRYNNQDHAMLTGLMAARNILHGESHDLWNVNEEKTYHEESRAGEAVAGSELKFHLTKLEPSETDGALVSSGVAAVSETQLDS